FLAFGNPFAKDVPNIWVVSNHNERPTTYTEKKLNEAFKKRARIYKGEGKRLVYGTNDGLPGLVADEFDNHNIVQINTAGIDKYRETVTEIFSKNYANKTIVLLDNKKYREAEGLPIHEQSERAEIVTINDSNLSSSLPIQ